MFKHVNTFAIGGLENIGYSNDNLIVLSSQGRGIFDCLSGTKIYRDDKNWWNDYDEKVNSIPGFDIEVNNQIKLIGIHGGQQLPCKTVDG